MADAEHVPGGHLTQFVMYAMLPIRYLSSIRISIILSLPPSCAGVETTVSACSNAHFYQVRLRDGIYPEGPASGAYCLITSFKMALHVRGLRHKER